MTVTYQLSADDYRHALIAYRNRNFLSRWFMILMALLFAVWGIVQVASRQSWMHWSLPASVVAIAIVLFVHWGNPYLNARRQFRSTPSAQEQISLEMRDEGLRFHSGTTDALVSWDHYKKWIEGESVFVLFTSAVIFVLVPKRAFDPDQLVLFKETLRQKIPA